MERRAADRVGPLGHAQAGPADREDQPARAEAAALALDPNATLDELDAASGASLEQRVELEAAADPLDVLAKERDRGRAAWPGKHPAVEPGLGLGEVMQREGFDIEILIEGRAQMAHRQDLGPAVPLGEGARMRIEQAQRRAASTQASSGVEAMDASADDQPVELAHAAVVYSAWCSMAFAQLYKRAFDRRPGPSFDRQTMADAFSEVGPWDRVAEGYVEATKPLLASFARDVLDKLALEPGHVVLDVATGPGTLALEAAQRVARVEALDFAPAMVEAFEQARVASGADNVRVQQGDGQALPFGEASFDRAFSNFGLMFFPDRAKGFAELHRVLRVGGRAAVTSWQRLERSPLFELMVGSLRAAGAIPEPDPDAEPPPGLDDPDRFRAELEAAGFVDVEIRELAHAMHIESADAFWAELELGNVLFQEMRRHHGDATFDGFAERARAWLAEQIKGPGDYPALAYLGIGHKGRA